MNPLLQAWRNASSVQQLGLAGLALVMLGVGCYLLILSPAHARRAALETRLAALQRELGEAHTLVDGLARYRQEKLEIEGWLELIAQRLPAAREIPPLYRALYEAAAQTGLAVALFRPREPRVETYYTEIPIALTAHGTYHRLGRFLARIADLPRVVTIDDLTITGIERPQVSLRAEMILTTYVYRPVGAPPPTRPVAPVRVEGAPKTGGPRP